MNGETLVAGIVGAHPGPAIHMALLGIVVVVGLVIMGIVRWRNKRGAVSNRPPDGR